MPEAVCSLDGVFCEQAARAKVVLRAMRLSFKVVFIQNSLVVKMLTMFYAVALCVEMDISVGILCLVKIGEDYTGE